MENQIDLLTKWTALTSHFSTNDELVMACWNELSSNYSEKDRYYHNLAHLEFMLILSESITELLDDPHALLFAVFYHDVIYEPMRKDNELKSAELAEERMKELDVSPETIHRTTRHILATEKHMDSSDPDTNFMLDLDLAILGSEEEIYLAYMNNVREEYRQIDDNTYYRERRKVLENFIDRDRIFHTDLFFNHFEANARANILKELTTF